jgi:hypothetical protein
MNRNDGYASLPFLPLEYANCNVHRYRDMVM